MNKKQAYWLCQLAGWGFMVSIETVNYTFFIVQRFEWGYFLSFVQSAVTGVLMTHLFRYLLLRFHWLGEGRLPRLLGVGVVSILVMSAALLFSDLVISYATTDTGAANFSNVNSVYVVAAILNWARYVTVWVVIYFAFLLSEYNYARALSGLQLANQLKDAELQNLKAQLNPHFLFNALNSITSLTISQPDKARAAVLLLSDLLRFTLNYERSPVVSLDTELNAVRDYLELETIRFGKRLQTDWDIDDRLLHRTVPAAAVLTLVENAIKHGISRLIDGGKVLIKAYETPEGFCVEVSNSGEYAPDPGRHGIGVDNVQRRLTMLYGKQASLQISQTEPMLVTARLFIPNQPMDAVPKKIQDTV